MAELRDEKLDMWIRNNLNVLFIGRHGVGKTARVIEAFNRNKVVWRYFSAATMDPWVDFIGVPRAVKNDDGSYHLELIRPKEFQEDTIEALFMDEFNRSHRKVRNAVMELIQFKSINGRKFKNLKIIWAAINPEDDEEEYQVEPLDPAQKDRFHCHITIPYKPVYAFFEKEYGDRMAKAAMDWWEGMPPEQKRLVSPRRLSYALDIYKMKGGDPKDVLPHACNVSKLINTINNGPASERLKEFFDTKEQEAARKYLAIENNYASAVPYLTNGQEFRIPNHDWMGFFLPLLPMEKLSTLIATNANVENHVLAFLADDEDVPAYRKAGQDILDANTNKRLCRKLAKVLGSNKTLAAVFGKLRNPTPSKPYFNPASQATNWASELANFLAAPMEKTPQRMKIYAELASTLPPTMTPTEASDTLELLNLLVGRAQKDSLKDYRHLLGVINHCIDQISKGSKLSWVEILTIHGTRFERLLMKIQEAGLDHEILCPIGQQSIAELVTDRHDGKFVDRSRVMNPATIADAIVEAGESLMDEIEDYEGPPLAIDATGQRYKPNGK